jgi:molybdopterin synthase catalytic subunit
MQVAKAPVTKTDVRLLDQPFSAMDELTAFTISHPEAGGLVSFLGQVRQEGGAFAVEALELRHYAALTLPGMVALAAAAEARWALDGLLILHRYGVLHPGDPIVLVAAAARHRRNAFAAADFAMDHLKSQSWFWKREKTAKGWRWIEPRPDDHHDLARW